MLVNTILFPHLFDTILLKYRLKIL